MGTKGGNCKYLLARLNCVFNGTCQYLFVIRKCTQLLIYRTKQF